MNDGALRLTYGSLPLSMLLQRIADNGGQVPATKQPVVIEKPTVIAATPTAQPVEALKPVEITPVKETVVEKPVVSLPEVTTSQEKTISDCLVDFVGPMIVNRFAHVGYA